MKDGTRFSSKILFAVIISAGLIGYALYNKGLLNHFLAERETMNIDSILSQNPGKIRLLLLGRDGCPGTAKATTVLEELAEQEPNNGAIIRIDVPLSGETLEPFPEGGCRFPRFADSGRLIAKELDFFYYPTLYVFDKDGTKRFVGGCDKPFIAQMIKEIVAEGPEYAKKIYTMEMPALGSIAPVFSGASDDKTLSLDSLLGENGLLIFFSNSSCIFSNQALPHLQNIADIVRGLGVSTVIINRKEVVVSDNSKYETQCAGVPVVYDHTGEIFQSFGVDATPFYYLLDKEAKIIKHRSFTHAVAMNSVNAMLGLEPEKRRFESTKAG
jgi:thiol-disulfide isomerase/thioredoxin